MLAKDLPMNIEEPDMDSSADKEEPLAKNHGTSHLVREEGVSGAVGTAVGITAGAAAGGAVGAVGGPAGMAVGALVGAAVGGLAGRAAGGTVDPELEKGQGSGTDPIDDDSSNP